MGKIMYVKTVKSYDEIVRHKKKRMRVLQKAAFWWKAFWYQPMIEQTEFPVCYLPVYKRINFKTWDAFFHNLKKKLREGYQLVLSNEMLSKNANVYAEKYGITIWNNKFMKKLLVLKALDKIQDIQPKAENSNIAVLCNEPSVMYIYLICELATKYKAIKIVSKHTGKFRKLEHDLYQRLGIAIQLSNSNQKSLLKPDIIINLDFSNIEINEYQLNCDAIIINTEDKIKIRAKSFRGIVINSYRIKFSKELRNKFLKQNMWYNFGKLELYAGVMKWEQSDYYMMLEQLEIHQVKIICFIGNNGKINEEEFALIGSKEVI